MFGLQARAAARLVGRPGAGRRGDAVTSTVVQLVIAGLLVVLGGLSAGAEAALSRVSRIASEDLEREGRRGAGRLREVARGPGALPQPADPAAGHLRAASRPCSSRSRCST